MTLQTEHLRVIEQVRAFIERSDPMDYKPKDRTFTYAFVRRTLVAFHYDRIGLADPDRNRNLHKSSSRITGIYFQQASLVIVI